MADETDKATTLADIEARLAQLTADVAALKGEIGISAIEEELVGGSKMPVTLNMWAAMDIPVEPPPVIPPPIPEDEKEERS